MYGDEYYVKVPLFAVVISRWILIDIISKTSEGTSKMRSTTQRAPHRGRDDPSTYRREKRGSSPKNEEGTGLKGNERVIIDEKRDGIHLYATVIQNYKFRGEAKVWVYEICFSKLTAIETLRTGTEHSVRIRGSDNITLWKECVVFEYPGPESDQKLINRAQEEILKKREVVNAFFEL